MRRYFAVALFAILMAISSLCFAERGVIAYVDDDYIIVETSMGDYTCAEISFITPPMYAGDTIFGELDMYGFYKWYNREADAEFDVYVDEYWLNASAALNWLQSKQF